MASSGWNSLAYGGSDSFKSSGPTYCPEGNLGARCRKDRGIGKEDIVDIVYMYYVDNEDVSNIADKYGVERSIISTIAAGRNFSKEWSAAVIDLVVSGHDCSRSVRLDSIEETKKRNKL